MMVHLAVHDHSDFHTNKKYQCFKNVSNYKITLKLQFQHMWVSCYYNIPGQKAYISFYFVNRAPPWKNSLFLIVNFIIFVTSLLYL